MHNFWDVGTPSGVAYGVHLSSKITFYKSAQGAGFTAGALTLVAASACMEVQ
jgi:hypothetical protein